MCFVFLWCNNTVLWGLWIAKHSAEALVFLFWEGILELKSYNTEEQKYWYLTADDTEKLSSFYCD